MPFAESFIKGHQAGLAQMQARQEMEERKADRELKIKLLKLQNEMEQRQSEKAAKLQQFQLQQGQPGQANPLASLSPKEPVTWHGEDLGTQQLPATMPNRPISIPLDTGAPAGYEELGVTPRQQTSINLTPQTKEEITAQTLQDTLQKMALEAQGAGMKKAAEAPFAAPTVVNTPAGGTSTVLRPGLPPQIIRGQEKEPGMTEAELTERSLQGDGRAQLILDAMQRRKIEISKSTAQFYPGQMVRLQDPSGKLLGTWNQQTGEFHPSAGLPEGAYAGGSPSIPETTLEQISGMKTALDLFKDMEPVLKRQKTLGPVVGRLKVLEVGKVGGVGASADEIEMAQKLYRIVTSQAFANGGKQLTITELERFKYLTPSLDDTYEQALIKTKESMEYLKRALGNRITALPGRARDMIDKSFKDAAIFEKENKNDVIEWGKDAQGNPVPIKR